MQDKKEYILEKAFEVFMAKGYDSASMTVLQKELKIARGGMYRYFESKDALFRAVIDKYFWGFIEFVSPYFKDDMTLAERIEQSYKSLKQVAEYLDKIMHHEVVFLNYTALIIQAAKHYPGFAERASKYRDDEFKKWKLTIENSIAKGEVRKDIDVKIIAQVFTKAVVSEDERGTKKNFKRSADNTKKTLDYIYSLIKT